MIFNRSSFINSETAIGFATLKQFWKWSQILILSHSWPCTQNEAKILIVNLQMSEKCDFLWMTSNIDILYTVGKPFSPRVWILYRYLKIRLSFAQINRQNLPFLHEKVCQRSGHFCREQGVLLWRGDQEEFVGTQLGLQNWPENDGVCQGDMIFPRVAYTADNDDWVVGMPPPTISTSSDTSGLDRVAVWSATIDDRAVAIHPTRRERERERERSSREETGWDELREVAWGSSKLSLVDE